jgi:conjugal transfer ATP-binding protein TraC
MLISKIGRAVPINTIRSISPEFSFCENLPYLSYEDGIYTLTGKRKGFMFEFTPLPFSSKQVEKDIESIIDGILPSGSTMQFHVFTSQRFEFMFERAINMIQQYPDSKLSPEIYKSIEMYQMNMFRKKNIKRWRYFASFSCIDKSGIDVNKVSASVKQTLRGAGLAPITVIPHRLISFLSEIFNITGDINNIVYDPHIHIRNQIIHSNSAISREGWFWKTRLKINDKYVVSLHVKEYPECIYLPLMNNLLGVPGDSFKQIQYPFLITFNHLNPSMQQLEATRIDSRASTTLSSSFGVTPSLQKRKEAMKNIKWALGKNHIVTKNYLHFLLFVDSEKEIPDAIENMKAVGRNVGFKLVPDTIATIPSFLSDLPMNLQPEMAKIGYLQTTHSQIASNMILCQGDDNGGRTPTIVLATERNDLAPLCFFTTEGNKNVTVTGKSGSGKSVFINVLLLGYSKKGAKVYNFDKGCSLLPITQIHGGDILRFDDKTQISINPFTHLKNIDGEVDFVWPIIAQMINPDGDLTQYHKEVLKEKIIEEYLSKRNNGSIQGVYDRLKSSKVGYELTLCMKSWVKDEVEGNYAKYLKGDSTISFDKQFALLELQEIDKIPALKAVIVPLYLFQVYLNCFFGDPNRIKIITMDEAHGYIHGQSMVRFMDTFIREIRKYNGMILTATQHNRDYFVNSAVATIYGNSDSHIFLKQDAAEGPMYPGLSSYEIEIINSLKSTPEFSEMYIKSPIAQGKYRVRLSEYVLWLSTTSPAVRAIRDENTERFKGDVHGSILDLVERKQMPAGVGLVDDNFY